MIAERVDDPIELSDPLAAGRTAVIGIRFGIRNERVHLAVLRASDADAARAARIVAVALNALRLRVDHEDPIVLVDEDSTGAAELLPLVEELPILIEYLDAIVRTVGHEHPAPRIHGDCMRPIEFARRCAFLAPSLDELSIFCELHHAVVRIVANVAVGNEDIAVGCDNDGRWLIERVGTIAGNASLAKPHQHLAVRRELENLMTDAALRVDVGRPDVAVAINVEPVRLYE